jgi:hypothetical protein
MITLRIETHVFTALRVGFDAAANDDAPVDPELLDRVRTALTEASATALPGLPILLTLASAYEMDVMAACFEVGGECNPAVSDDQWDAILALIDQAACSHNLPAGAEPAIS